MSAAERASNNMAKAQAMPRIPPSGTAQCPVGRVRIGVFFDGTGCNMHRDKNPNPMNPAGGKAPSNVPKLYNAYKQEGTVLKKIYHHGPGTDSDYTVMNIGGLAFGAGGKDRVEWGRNQLSDFYSNNNNHLAKEKHFDIYGYSRGAAISRDFANTVKTKGIDNLKEQNGHKWRMVGRVPIREKAWARHQGVKPMFLGVFDTVGSFMLGGAKVGDWLSGFDFFIDHTWVHRTVHMVAEDEVRSNFPLTSLFMDPKKKGSQNPQDYKDVMVEIWYPGTHGNIGGGCVLEPGKDAVPEKQVPRVGAHGEVIWMTERAKPAILPVKPHVELITLRDMNEASIFHQVPMSKINPSIPGDLLKLYSEYDSYRSGQPFAIGKRYIQSNDSKTYQALYFGSREIQPSVKALKANYISDSRWPHDKWFNRTQRTVHYMGPQPKRK
jgi:hypothetical protein